MRVSRAEAISLFGTAYIPLDQTLHWINTRVPKFFRRSAGGTGSVDYIVEGMHQGLHSFQDWVDGKYRSNQFRIDEYTLEALRELRQALESGRVSATARRGWTAIPRTLPSHFWPRLTFEIRRYARRYEACVSLNDSNWSNFWSDLLFRADQVVTIWPPRNEKGRLKADADETNAVHRIATRSELRKASESRIHEAISKEYDKAERAGLKPPNVREIVRPVQESLRSEGYQATGRRIERLADSEVHKRRRRRPGRTLASEKRLRCR